MTSPPRQPHDFTVLANELKQYEVRPPVILHPGLWSKLRLPIALKWQCIRFSKATAAQVPVAYGGVYSFIVKPAIANNPHVSFLMYVGKTDGAEGFRGRYQRYLRHAVESKTARPAIRAMLDKWPDHLWFCFAKVQLSDAELSAIEDSLIEAYQPPYCSFFRGKYGKARKAW